MRKAASGLVQILLILFPIIAVAFVQTTGAAVLVAGLCGLLALQVACGRANSVPKPLVVVAPIVLLALATMATIDPELAVLIYPVLINALLAIVFGATLIWPPSMIERFARMTDPDFPEHAVPYVRRITAAWIVFFVINGGIALWTALFASWAVWALYNGLISYLLIGALFFGEMLLRPHLRPRASGA